MKVELDEGTKKLFDVEPKKLISDETQIAELSVGG